MKRDRSRDHERYQRLKAEGRCIQCSGKLLPEWEQLTRCPECREAISASGKRYRRKNADKIAAQRKLEPVRRRINALRSARVLKHKVDGRCLDCREQALDDSSFCERHREMHRASNRDYARRKRAAEKRGVPVELKRMGRKQALGTRIIGRPYTPPAPKPPGVQQRVLIAASHFDEFTNIDLQEATGLSGDLLSTKIYRLKKLGLIERTSGQQGANDSTYRVVRRAA